MNIYAKTIFSKTKETTEDITQLSDKDKKERTWMQVDGEKNFENLMENTYTQELVAVSKHSKHRD